MWMNARFKEDKAREQRRKQQKQERLKRRKEAKVKKKRKEIANVEIRHKTSRRSIRRLVIKKNQRLFSTVKEFFIMILPLPPQKNLLLDTGAGWYCTKVEFYYILPTCTVPIT